MLSSYFKCLALHLGRQDTREAAAQLEEELQENVNLNWSFEEVRTWLDSADLDVHTTDYILSITDRLESTGSKEARQDTFRIYVHGEDAEPKQLPSAPEEDT